MLNKKSALHKLALLLILIMAFSGVASATMNVAVITDPTGKDPNGCAAGSQSFAPNMFQSTFIYAQQYKTALLSGGEGTYKPRLAAMVEALTTIENNGTPAQAVASASKYNGIRLMAVNPTQGIAVGGDYAVYVVTVSDNGTINVKAYDNTASNGTGSSIAQVPAGTKGAIIHLRNSEGNPKAGTADTVRLQTAINMGKMIRDGYPATEVVGQAFKEVAQDSGEDHGGGAINLVSGVTTGEMFTPKEVNQTGYPMETAYSKVGTNGWSAGFPEAANYQVNPIDGSQLTTVYAYQALVNTITVTSDNPSVSVYGSDKTGLSDATTDVVDSTIQTSGYDPVKIAKAINNAIDDGVIVGVEHVDSSDINVKESIKAVGVYYSPLPNNRTAPEWSLPIDSQIFDVIGNIETVFGILLILLALFRSTLIKSFFRRR